MSAPDTPRLTREALTRCLSHRIRVCGATKIDVSALHYLTATCLTCRHHTLDDKGDHWCALGISTAGRVPGLVTHLQPFGCSLHEGKETT